eukprot:UN04257
MQTRESHTRADISLLDKKVVTCSKRCCMFILSLFVLLIIITEFLTKNVTKELSIDYCCQDGSFGLFCKNNQPSLISDELLELEVSPARVISGETDRYSTNEQNRVNYINPFFWIIGCNIGGLFVVFMQISSCITSKKMQGLVILFAFLYCFVIEIGLPALEIYCKYQLNPIGFSNNVKQLVWNING